MATSFITTDQTTTQILTSGNSLYLAEGVSIIPAVGNGINSSLATDFDLDLFIGGAVTSVSAAISMDSDANGDYSGTGFYDITIAKTGTVVSFLGGALQTGGRGNIVTNFGILTTLSSANAGYQNVGDDLSLRNFGEISGGRGINLHNSGDNNEATVENHGLVLGELYGIIATVNLTLNNTGSIIASNDAGSSFGVFVNNTAASFNGSHIQNSGIISGYETAIIFSDSYNNSVTNSGEIIGDVLFSLGDDTFDGRGGTVDGDVKGGNGNDTYIVDDTTINLIELASQGTDTVQSTVSWKLAANFESVTLLGTDNTRGIGNGLNNILTGNAGDNRLRGKGGADTISGNDGDDRISGNIGNDLISGNDGNDKIWGNRGNDALFGGEGKDRLIGGKGADVLTGGEDVDTFVFARVGHSVRGGDFDSVTDFVAGEDRIDLSGLNRDFTFLDTSGLTGTGVAEVRLRITGAKTTVQVDVDGDGTYDMRIDLNGSFGLDAADFIL